MCGTAHGMRNIPDRGAHEVSPGFTGDWANRVLVGPGVAARTNCGLSPSTDVAPPKTFPIPLGCQSAAAGVADPTVASGDRRKAPVNGVMIAIRAATTSSETWIDVARARNPSRGGPARKPV